MAWKYGAVPRRGLPDFMSLTPFFLVVLVGYIFFRFALDEWPLVSRLINESTVEEAELDSLAVGDEVWLDVELEGPDSSEIEPWFEDHVYGCKGYWNQGDEGSWVNDGYFSPALRVRVGDRALQVQLTGCPEGDFAEAKHESREYEGYRSGQRLSLLGTVVQEEPLSVKVTEHRGGTARAHLLEVVAMEAVFGVLATLATLALLGVGWYFLGARALRETWEQFAAENSLQISRKRFWGLGRIHGRIRDREVEIYRRRGLGDGDALPSDLLLRIELQPCMKAYEMRGQASVERWLLVLGGEEEIGDSELDPLFVLRGVDGARWRTLLGNAEIRERLLELRSNRVQIGMNEGWMTLHWPGLDTEVLDRILPLALVLVERMEAVEGQGWIRAAEALGLGFEKDEHSHWRIRCEESLPKWDLRYGNTDGWQTLFELTLSASVPERWRVATGGTERSNRRSGDPVLDDQLDFRGFEDGELEVLIARPDATEILLASIRGHGVVIEEQRLRLRHPGLVAEPLELLQDAIRLACLFDGAEPVPGEVDRIGDNER